MTDRTEAMENLFQAIDIITQERLSNLGYDKTIKATIVDDSKAAQGTYELEYGANNIFTAHCDASMVYKTGMVVYVIIPQGDWNNDKLIVGKYSNNGDDYYNYANPSDDFFDVTHNLISEVNAQSLLANDPSRPYVTVWSCDGVEYKGYNRLALKGNFRTWLSSLDVMKGTYGLVLYVVSKESRYDTGDFERTYKFDLFTDDMYGDPFNFETYYLQEKVFDISNLSNIIHMELLLVQNSDFYNTDNQLVAYKTENGDYFPDNIFVQQPYISLGYDLNDVFEDEVRLYTLDSEEYDATYEESNIRKTMNVRWIHIQEDGSVVAIDKEDEIPANSVIRWYKYILDRSVSDKLAGAFWEEIEEARNCFSYSFVPDILVGSEKFKVIVECPSREAIIAQLEESEFVDFVGVEIKDKEEQVINDEEVLRNALHSYNDNSLLSFQEYKQIIEEYNKVYKIANGVNYPNYEKAIIILDNIQRAQSNVCIYRSEILEFKNLSYDPVAAAIDLISGLTILVDAAGYNGSYLLYDDSGMIINAAEAVRKRILTATYQSLITGEEVLDRAEKIVWYFPLESSMIYPPQLGTEYSQYELYSELTEEEITALELPCRYCRIERAIPEVLEGDAGEEIARQTEQIFRIKDYYTQTATNNTIYCAVFKNGREYKAEASLTFGISGTCGTDATFLLQMMEWDEENNIPTTHPVSALTIGKSVAIVPKFYDYNNNDITDEYLSTHTITYSWHTSESNGQGALQRADGMTNPKWTRLYVDSGAGIDKCQYYILSASVYWSIVKYKKDEWGRTVLDEMGQPVIDEGVKDLETRDVQLKTFLTIPVRTSDEYTQIVGPTQIVYNKDGTNAAYYNAPFVLYKNGEEIEARWMLSCKEYLDSGSDTASRDSRILNYYPSLDGETGKLTPKEMFLSDGKPLAVEAIVDGEVVWTQPILIIKNKYSSAMLNAWDGEMCIDQENGTIMSTMVGAGKKDVNNTFTGVLMGDVAAGAGFDNRNHSGIGIYGFHQGEQSFGFNVNGTAFIGKAGRGRICMDGNKGTIQSGVYTKNSAGMLIDLDGEDETSAALFAYGDGGAFELNTNGNKPLLEIRNTAAADSAVLVHIGRLDDDNERKFYIQSANYDGTSKGTKFDLNKGTIDIYHEGGSYIKMDGDGTPYLQIYDGSSGKDIFYAGTSKYQLESTDFVSGEKGIFIDLQRGNFEARSGIIGGWTINKDTLTAESITLNSNGSMSGGTTYQWSIDTEGKANFSYITAAGGGAIGPFIINSESLYIGASGFQSASVYLGTSGVSVGGKAFSASSDGNVYIGGKLTVEGPTTLNSTLTVQGGQIVAGGSGGSFGGGGYYTLSSTGGNIGPWKIGTEAIETETGSWLGASGEIKLTNGAGIFKILEGSGLSFTATGTETFTINKGLNYNNDNGEFSISSSGVRIKGGGDGNGLFTMSSSGVWLSGSSSGEVGYIQLGSTSAKMVGGGGGSGSRIEVDQSGVLLSINGSKDSFKLSTTTIVIDGKECKQKKVINVRNAWNKNTKLTFVKGLLIDDGITDGDGEDATDLEIDTDLKVSGNIYAYKPGTKTLTALGKLAFSDYVSKKVDVTLTGRVSVPYPGGGGGTVYIKVDKETGKYLSASTNYASSTKTVQVYTVKVNGSSGGYQPVDVKLQKTFTADFYPSEDDDTETFSYNADSAKIV